MPDGLDDRDEFSAGGYAPPTPEELVEIERYLAHRKTLKSRDQLPKGSPYRFPHTVVNSDQMAGGKRTIDIQCQLPGCQNTRRVFVSDLFQVYECIEHRDLMRRYNRTIRAERIAQRMRELGMTESAQPLDDQDEFHKNMIFCQMPDCMAPPMDGAAYCGTHGRPVKEDLDDADEFNNPIEDMLANLAPEDRQKIEAEMQQMNTRQRCQYCGEAVDPEELDVHGPGQCDQRPCSRCGAPHQCVKLEDCVSNKPVVAEELGGIRPAHLLVKAKHDSSWIEYVDAEGNTKFMQVHDVRSARDAYGRWAVYGIDQNGDPVHELYDLRHGFEHSGTFSGIRELQFGEIVKLAQQGVIRGKDGKEIRTLGGLMQIADEPLRKMIIKKAKEAKAGGPPLGDIEKQLLAEPTASSAQKRAGKAGTRPWARKLMSS